MKKIILALALGFVVMNTAEARHYGMAGCGLGSNVFNDDGIVQQVLATTTNGTSYNQTFGISSGTSNCTDDGVVRAGYEVPMFIESNQIALATESARGNGETIEHLASLIGCEKSGSVGSVLQKNYRNIFSTENIKGSKVTNSIIDTLRQNKGFAQECKNLI